MAAKYQLITELYRRTGIAVAKNPQAWQGFLSSACRNYKCRFDEQLLIYAQRPDAVAVAKLETWNRQFKRWVNKDSKGIAVFDPKGRRNTLKYYFDVSDTHEGYYGSRPVPIWQMDERYEQAVMERLSDRFGDVESTDLASDLMETAKNAVEDNLQDYFSQLKDCTKDSFLEELDDFNIEVIYRRLATSGKKKPYALYQAEKQGRPTRDNVARQAVDEAISKSFTLKDFDRQLAEMGYRINFDPNRKYWTIIGKGWQRPKRLYKLGEEYTNDRIMERISENSYAVKFQSFSEPQVKVYRVKGSLKNARKIGGLRGLYLHYCYKLGILPKGRKQNYARLHYLLKDDLMKMEAITQETRLLCRNHIDTAEQLCSYKGSLETEMSALLQKRKELYSKSRRTSGEEKEAVKAELSDISGRLKIIRKEVRLCEGIAARSDTLKEKLQTIRADEHEQQRKELMKNEHRRRSGRTNRPNELGGL